MSMVGFMNMPEILCIMQIRTKLHSGSSLQLSGGGNINVQTKARESGKAPKKIYL